MGDSKIEKEMDDIKHRVAMLEVSFNAITHILADIRTGRRPEKPEFKKSFREWTKKEHNASDERRVSRPLNPVVGHTSSEGGRE